MCEFSLVIVICKQLRIGAYEPDSLFYSQWLVFRYCGRLYCRRCVKSECFVYLVSGVQMNTFFKPALSLLLELNLGDTGIERRLHPLITFLTRHRAALRKYIYPECFATLMNYLWSYILQVSRASLAASFGIYFTFCTTTAASSTLLALCTCSLLRLLLALTRILAV